MKETVIVLGARGWALVDEKTGESRQGVSLHYLLTDNLKAVQNDADGTEGYIPTKQSITVEQAKNLKDVPGVYEGEFSLRSSGGKTILALTALKFVGPVKG